MTATRSESGPAAELVLDAKAELGEGPLWSARERRLCWVDVDAGAVHLTDPATGSDHAIAVGTTVGAVVERASGGLAAATRRGFAGLDPASGAVDWWTNPEPHLPGNRFNDGKVDARGRFWAGTMACDVSQPPAGSLYRLDVERRAHRLVGGIGIANGLAWSADGRTFSYIDTPTRRIDAFVCDPDSGALGERRVAVDLADRRGLPDGMCIDAEGMLWVAFWDGWAVERIDPRSGRTLRTIRLPCAKVTSCCFGGDHLDQLYITTARIGLTADELAEQPLAGGVFRAQVGRIGLPSTPFAG